MTRNLIIWSGALVLAAGMLAAPARACEAKGKVIIHRSSSSDDDGKLIIHRSSSSDEKVGDREAGLDTADDPRTRFRRALLRYRNLVEQVNETSTWDEEAGRLWEEVSRLLDEEAGRQLEEERAREAEAKAEAAPAPDTEQEGVLKEATAILFELQSLKDSPVEGEPEAGETAPAPAPGVTDAPADPMDALPPEVVREIESVIRRLELLRERLTGDNQKPEEPSPAPERADLE